MQNSKLWFNNTQAAHSYVFALFWCLTNMNIWSCETIIFFKSTKTATFRFETTRGSVKIGRICISFVIVSLQMFIKLINSVL